MTDQPAAPPFDVLDAAVELLGRAGVGGTLRVQGRSMLPTLHAGQRLRVEFSTTGARRRGELLLYRQDDYLVVHRFVGESGTGAGRRLLTRGDGVLSLDPPLDPANVLGRVVAVETADGWRALVGRAARAYGGCVAWHCRAWHAVGRVAGVADHALGRLGVRPIARSVVWRCDRAALALAHALVFRSMHRRLAE